MALTRDPWEADFEKDYSVWQAAVTSGNFVMAMNTARAMQRQWGKNPDLYGRATSCLLLTEAWMDATCAALRWQDGDGEGALHHLVSADTKLLSCGHPDAFLCKGHLDCVAHRIHLVMHVGSMPPETIPQHLLLMTEDVRQGLLQAWEMKRALHIAGTRLAPAVLSQLAVDISITLNDETLATLAMEVRACRWKRASSSSSSP